MLLGVQILGILFALWLLYLSFLHYKRNEFNTTEFSFWVLLWVLFGFVTIFPNSLEFAVDTLSLARKMDLFTIIGFLFLTALTFYNYTTVKKSKNKLENVVRKLAIDNVEKGTEAK